MSAQPTLLSRRPINPERLITAYTTAVALLGAIFILTAAASLSPLGTDLWIFILAAGVAELFSVELFRNSRSRVSVSTVISVACILSFGPLAGVLSEMFSGLMTTITTTFFQKQQNAKGRAPWLRRSTFNIGMLVIASAVSGYTYVLTGGFPGDVGRLTNAVPLVMATAMGVLVNILLLIGVIALQTRQDPFQIWRRDMQWGVPIAIACSVLGGGGLSLIHAQFGLLGFLVLFLPVLFTNYSFRVYIKNTRGYVEQLEEVNQDLSEVNISLLETLGAIIDAYDVYTFGHSNQVAVYAGEIAARMGMTAVEQAEIVQAALVHDIGKVGVTDRVITKPGPLTEDEYNLMIRHPVIGAEILARMKGLQGIAPLVRYHHERWDGRGYPEGLKGTRIPLGARVIALADSVDAMCSDRPYRPTRNFESVLSEVQRCSGAQFDPEVVSAFLRLVEERGALFFKNSAALVDRNQIMASLGRANRDFRNLQKSLLPEKQSLD